MLWMSLSLQISQLEGENEDLKSKASQLRDENKKLREELCHYQWHIGVYHSTLEKFSKSTLPIYHETFRKFRDYRSECAQCTNVRLLEKNDQLENKIEIYEMSLGIHKKKRYVCATE